MVTHIIEALARLRHDLERLQHDIRVLARHTKGPRRAPGARRLRVDADDAPPAEDPPWLRAYA